MKKSIEQMRADLISKLKTLEAKEDAMLEAQRQKSNQVFIKSAQAAAKSAGVDFGKVDADRLKVGLGQLMAFLKAGSVGGAGSNGVGLDRPA